MRRTLLPLAVMFLLVVGTGTAQAATINIETRDNEFVPPTATANVGDTISFKNTGAAPHNAVANNGAFNIPLINPGETKTATVDQPGPVDYVCSFHVSLGMRGTITVEGAAGAPAAGAEQPQPGQEGETNPPADQAEAEGKAEGGAPEGGEEGGDSGQEQGDQEGGSEEGAEGEDEEALAAEAPPTEKLFMPLAMLIALLVLLGMIPAAKTFLLPALKAAGDAPTHPVGPPPTIQALSAAPAAAVAAPPAPPAAPAAAPSAPAAAPPPTASPTPAAPPPGKASPVEPTAPPLDPEKVYQAVLHDEQEKGTDARVAEARAKAARMRAEEALATPAPAAASAPAPAAPPAAAEAAAAPAAEAPPAPAAEAAPAPEAAAAPAEAPRKGVSAEEAAEIRKKVYEEELAKGTDARVAEARAKAAEMRAKKGTSLPSK